MATVWATNHLNAYFLQGISGPHTLSILIYIYPSVIKDEKIIHQRLLETLCHKSWKLPPSKAVLGEGQRILLNASSVFYFLENREKSPLQYLLTNTWSCIRMSVFSPQILSKTTIRGQSMLKFF